MRPVPEVTIYTDGGADPNPGTGGWAAILIDPASGKARELSGGEPHATNNRMELTAAIRALEALKQPCRVHLFTDSQYLRKGITEWLPGWIARGWRRKDGELQNEDLWRRLAELVAAHEIHWDWVKGHAGNQLERAGGRAGHAGDPQAAGRRKAPVPQPRRPTPRSSCASPAPAARGRLGGAGPPREEESVLSGGLPGTTSNQLDLLGAIAALESAAAGDLRRRPHRLGLPEERGHPLDRGLEAARLEDPGGPAGAEPRPLGAAGAGHDRPPGHLAGGQGTGPAGDEGAGEGGEGGVHGFLILEALRKPR